MSQWNIRKLCFLAIYRKSTITARVLTLVSFEDLLRIRVVFSLAIPERFPSFFHRDSVSTTIRLSSEPTEFVARIAGLI